MHLLIPCCKKKKNKKISATKSCAGDQLRKTQLPFFYSVVETKNRIARCKLRNSREKKKMGESELYKLYNYGEKWLNCKI